MNQIGQSSVAATIPAVSVLNLISLSDTGVKLFSGARVISSFVNKHTIIKILALSF